jgi:UDP-2,3-diacylglucosamine hydrolase
LNGKIFFISDIHFGLLTREKELERERLFVKFLQFAGNEAKAIYILGDLFDYWFEYKRVIQKGFFSHFNCYAGFSREWS